MIEHVHRPGSLREALALRRRLRDAAFLAGGTYINSADFEMAPTQVIGLEGLGLDRIGFAGKALRLGSGVTLQRLIDDRRVPAPLKAAVQQIVPRNVRNAATLGGHVAARLPQSDVLPMLVALKARLAISAGSAAKTVLVGEYAARPLPGLILHIEVPRPAASRAAACRNFRESANARSILSVAVSATVTRGAVRDPLIAISGLGRCVVRLTTVEHALDGRPLPDADAIEALVCAAARPAASPGASVALRRYEAGTLVALCLHELVAAKGGRP